ncbi:MAG TPA: hypothetical protein PLS03_08700 [Terrimicrobiaceae bacterium]|nr:hypothetical protein [Terrimicrobiaceae bacterium]
MEKKDGLIKLSAEGVLGRIVRHNAPLTLEATLELIAHGAGILLSDRAARQHDRG